MDIGRRVFLSTAAAALPVLASPAGANKSGRPRLGVIVDASTPDAVEKAMQKVKGFGLASCQASVGAVPSLSVAGPLKAAMKKYGVEVTAAMTLGPGHIEWNFYGGPLTCGLVPREMRAARIDALQKASDLAQECGIKAVHTHCGFIPEDPNEPLYSEVVEAIRTVGRHCGGNGQIFLMETGQESPVTLLRAITDTGLDNVKVNLDVANLILYGKGEPVGALDVIGKHVRGMHAKDGMYPTGPRELGKEVAIGKGRVNFPEVFRRLKELNYEGPVTIEREISGPQQLADIQASKHFLQGLIDKNYGPA
ncbi:MAG TPA: sugar phosphate isomerase/epimerase family protein [Bryobacteraceae bacterium]|jgi:sugar phosphate isomerase/epimerase|nr:sugar phosphate isomerase/epimerase family protein [Bryobacteraceae bacterium]